MLNDLVAAVVVTYNRLDLLKKVIDGLLRQTRQLDAIIVVNNSSTDGTSEWIAEIKEQNSLIRVINQENLGSSGGQYTGGKIAYDSGYEWIWHLDDDVVPAKDCLENLLKYAKYDHCVAPLRMKAHATPEAKEEIFYEHDIIRFNFSNPLRSIWRDVFTEDDYNYSESLICVEGITLEGMLLHRSMIEKVGYVEKGFFIYGDDTEYSVRLLRNNIRISIVKEAVIHRLLPMFDEYNFDWKTYYIIRNLIVIDVLHGNFLIRWIRPLGYLLTWLFRSKSRSNVRTTFRAFKDGYFYKSHNV